MPRLPGLCLVEPLFWLFSTVVQLNQMSDALSYVSKYLIEPKVVNTLPAGETPMDELPEWWRQVLLATGEERIRLTLQAWESQRVRLPTVFDYLSTHLRGVNLLTDRHPTTNAVSKRLLYEIDPGDQILYYAGGNPLQKSMKPEVQAVWNKLSLDVRSFYDSLHNGWYDLASVSMGPSPTEDFFFLSDFEWGILDDIADPGCDLSELLAVYTNGMGDHVALSVGQRSYGDVLWLKAKPPELNIDVWGVIDAWTEIGLSQ